MKKLSVVVILRLERDWQVWRCRQARMAGRYRQQVCRHVDRFLGESATRVWDQDEPLVVNASHLVERDLGTDNEPDSSSVVHPLQDAHRALSRPSENDSQASACPWMLIIAKRNSHMRYG
jgi:hypothetical protein